MELTNDFVVDRTVDETWAILNDLEFIAPCMPGAQLQEIEGEEYRGVVKVKVGPITAQYKGKARFVEQNAADHTAKLKAEGRDPRQGNANAMVTATMVEGDTPATTKVTVHTDLALSGKIASFGRGAIEDVSKKILGQFVDNLRDKLATESPEVVETAPMPVAEPAETAPAAAAPADGATADGASTDTPAAPAEPVTPTIRKIDAPEAEPVDLLDVAGDSMVKRLAPVLGGLVILLVVRALFRGKGD